VYRAQVTDALPATVPPGTAEIARDTLGCAVAATAQLPNQIGAALLDAARDAFTGGLQMAAAVSAAGAIGIAMLAAVLLRHVDPTGTQGEQGAGDDVVARVGERP
jgi:DHA2 family multidrug resistance protein-like MFS transporter